MEHYKTEKATSPSNFLKTWHWPIYHLHLKETVIEGTYDEHLFFVVCRPMKFNNFLKQSLTQKGFILLRHDAALHKSSNITVIH